MIDEAKILGAAVAKCVTCSIAAVGLWAAAAAIPGLPLISSIMIKYAQSIGMTALIFGGGAGLYAGAVVGSNIPVPGVDI